MDYLLRNYIQTHRQQMSDLLRKMVCINSGSHNKRGVDAVGRVITSALSGCGLTVEVIKENQVGNHLVVRNPLPSTASGQLLMVGHMDTVFAPGTPGGAYRENETHAYGPGVIDMKGGLVVGIYAIKALAAVGLLERLPLVFVCTSDEEIGSRYSKALIFREARKSTSAFVLEAGGPNGDIVTARKGNLSAKLTIKGKAGHAAFAGPDKASAILELAHKTLAVEALNDPTANITANVGTLQGGIGPNTIAEHAEARLDFRFNLPTDAEALQDRLAEIVAHTEVAGTAASLEIISGRPPMPVNEANQRLFARVKKVAGSLGMAVNPEYRPGVSDANFIAQTGTPVIDGMGPIGGKDHSPEEYMLIASLPRRILLMASVLADFA